MIKNFLIAGDQHGNFNNLIWNIDKDIYNPKETAIIVLGDAGINYYLNGKDNQLKNILMQSRYTFYILRGNHEERPERIKNMRMVFDDTVENFVYMQDAWDRIKYFIDGNIYNIKNYRCLTIGGAYSVDKYYRLERGWHWFEGEQLTPKEREDIMRNIKGQSFDFVLTHTCPFDYMPTDLFLASVDQSTVDNSTEHWLQDEVLANINYNVWLFGHFHDDRLVRPHMEMYFCHYDEIDYIYNNHMNNTHGYWRKKDPKYYYDDNPWNEKENN